MPKEPDYESAPMGDDAMAEDTDMDEELTMYAENLGFDSAKAADLKAFVERCVALKEEGSYDDEMPDDELEL